MMSLADITLFLDDMDFLSRAVIMAIAVAVPLALLSPFLVLKGWALMGDAISHAVFPGVVLAYVLGIPYAIGAFCAGMFSAVAIGFVKNNSRIRQDSAMGIVFAGMFGLGLVFYVKIQTAVHLEHILFGDMLGAAGEDIMLAAAIALVVAVAVCLKWKDFLLHAFDPVQAVVSGLPVNVLYYGLLALISLAIVGALQAVGFILPVAMLIAPGAIAFLLSRRFSAMLIVSLAVAVLCSVLGVYIATVLDSAPAPTIVLLLTIVFLFVFAFVSLRQHGYFFKGRT